MSNVAPLPQTGMSSVPYHEAKPSSAVPRSILTRASHRDRAAARSSASHQSMVSASMSKVPRAVTSRLGSMATWKASTSTLGSRGSNFTAPIETIWALGFFDHVSKSSMQCKVMWVSQSALKGRGLWVPVSKSSR